MAASAGIVIYHFIIRQQQTEQKTLSPSATPSLAAFGVVFPFIALEPIYLIEYLSIQNLGLRMMVLALPCGMSLRCLEGKFCISEIMKHYKNKIWWSNHLSAALFNFTPVAAKKSLKNYLIYSSCLMAIKFDTSNMEPSRTSSTFLKMQMMKLCRDYLSIVALMTMLQPRKFEFFETEISVDSMDHSLLDLISLKHIVNNFFVACKYSFCPFLAEH